ncbi:MAG: MMPL family transporter [Rhodoglobus sp.]
MVRHSAPSSAPGIGPLARLGAGAARHPVVTVLAWAGALALAVATAVFGVTGENLFDRLVSGAPTVDSGESTRADELLAGDDGERESLTIAVVGIPVDEPAALDAVAALGADLDGIPGTSLVTPVGIPPLADGSIDPRLAPLLAKQGDGFLVTVTLAGSGDAAPDDTDVDEALAALERAADGLRAGFPDATVELGGGSLLVDSIVAVSENDLRRGETVALPIALVIMLVVFGGLLAAGIPLAGAGAAIGGGLGLLFGFTHVTDIDTTVINVITAVGLGLSIDYGLLMVSRYREELRALPRQPGSTRVGRPARITAIARTADSAGRTVVFSGTTFLVASLGLLVFEPSMVRAIGLGAVAVTLIAIASAVTLVPALLSLAGDRLIRPGILTRMPWLGRGIARFGDVAPEEGFFSRLTRRVQRHPALISIACALVLIVLGSPLLTLKIANTSVDAIPASATQSAFLEALREHFPDASTPRAALVTGTRDDGERWAAGISGLEGVGSVGPTVERGDAWQTVVRVDPSDGVATVATIRSERDGIEWEGIPGLVTGIDAQTLDLTESLLASAPWAALVIGLGTVILLFLMTGSLVIPLKALVMSALSLGASIGVLVWGFEQGNFAGLMGFDAAHVHGVDVLVLVLTFAFGFGLAMDYEMFILSRVKELKDAGASDEEAIALGLQRSGRIISSAALIIVVVFAGFATGDLMVIKQLGTALAVAVLLDATLVRCLLVPALMTWQRRIMWWAPRWMKRLHARVGLRE